MSEIVVSVLEFGSVLSVAYALLKRYVLSINVLLKSHCYLCCLLNMFLYMVTGEG